MDVALSSHDGGRSLFRKSSWSCKTFVKSCHENWDFRDNFLHFGDVIKTTSTTHSVYNEAENMFPNFITRLSSRKKLIMLVSAVVLLPLTLLAYMQYRSLVELENKTKAAFKENLRQTLLSIEHRTGRRFETLAGQSLIPVAGIRFSDEAGERQLEKYFSEVKQSHPEIDQIFVFSYENGRFNDAYVYSNGFLKAKPENPEIHNLLYSFDLARASQNFIEPGHQFLFWLHSCSTCSAHGRTERPQTTLLFYPLADVSSGRPTGFAGLALNEKYVREEILARSVTEALSSPNLALPNSNVVVSVNDENQREIYTNLSGHQEYVIKTAFNPPFSNWSVTIGFKNTDIESLARRSFWESLLLTFLVLAVLLFGIVLTLRSTDREVSLAQAKSGFVSNVSHELKTPLSLIRLFAEILELGRVKDDDKKQEYYRIIGQESRRLTQLIDNILDFSKIEAGRMKYHFVDGDIGEIVEQVVSSYQYKIIDSGFKLAINIEDQTPPVRIDPAAVAQAVLNLLDNAVKYSRDVKEISIKVKTIAGFLTIETADRGIGVSRSEQAKIFEKFYRVGNELIHDVKGSGLGLALVKHIMEAHGGKISVVSKVGQGSSFTLYFPLDTKTAGETVPVKKGGGQIAESINN